MEKESKQFVAVGGIITFLSLLLYWLMYLESGVSDWFILLVIAGIVVGIILLFIGFLSNAKEEKNK